MSFLNPALLAFSAAVAIPILIHLLNRRRFRQVPWAAMRFLRTSIEKNRRRMQWEDLILLLLRCLVVALLALALARPALRAAAAFLETGRSAAVFVLDHSASLSASDGTRSRMELARQAAGAALDAYPPGSALAVLFSGDRVEELIAEPTYDLNLVRKTLREAPSSDLATDHGPSVLRAIEILRDQTTLRKEIVLITDRQASGWRRLPEIAAALQDVSRDTRLRVVMVGEPLDDNLGVRVLARSPGFAAAGEPIRFQAEIANNGVGIARQVRATLHLDDGPAVDEAVIDVLPPGQARRLTFFARLPAAGFHAITARLPTDRMPADDERTVIVRAIDKASVLIVEGDPEAHAGFFLRHALQPVPQEATADYFVQPHLAPPGQIALARLADYDAVILADVPPLAQPAVDALARYVRDGGALLCFPGPKAQPTFYNEDLVARAGLFGATLKGIRGNPEADEGMLELQAGPYDHPILELWNEAGAGSLTKAQFRAAWELSPLIVPTNSSLASTPTQVILRFTDGTPAAVERTVGQGRTLLFASTAGPTWNDLAVRPAFVPLLHRSVASLAEAQEEGINIRTGGRITLRMPSDLAGRDVVIVTPGQPGHRLTRPVRSGSDGARIEFDETFQAGPYWVTLPHETTPRAAFAAQLNPDESDLTEISPEAREDIARSAQLIDWQPEQDLRAAFERERVGVELWLPLALAVLLLGITETWLAQLFSRSK